MTDTTEACAARVAGELTKAQTKTVQHGFQHANWPTIKALEKAGLVNIRVCFPDGNGLTLTPLGEAVRKHLENER